MKNLQTEEINMLDNLLAYKEYQLRDKNYAQNWVTPSTLEIKYCYRSVIYIQMYI